MSSLHFYFTSQNLYDHSSEIRRAIDSGALRPEQSFSYVANPPPDTLFMLATGCDLVVFEDLDLMTVDHERIEIVRGFVGASEQTALALANYAKAHGHQANPMVLRFAIEDGSWPISADAMHQAAAFVHHLAKRLEKARDRGLQLVWSIEGATINYDY